MLPASAQYRPSAGTDQYCAIAVASAWCRSVGVSERRIDIGVSDRYRIDVGVSDWRRIDVGLVFWCWFTKNKINFN